MKTLILEPDAMRARGWIALYGASGHPVEVARSAAEARLMLIAARYDRFGLHMGRQGSESYALLSVARSVNADCEIVDLASMRSRRATGPMETIPATLLETRDRT